MRAMRVEDADAPLPVTKDDEVARIGYRPQTIRNLMARGVFQLDVHYFKPFGRPLFKWSSVVHLIEGAGRGEARRV